MAELKIEIITPDKVIFKGEIISVTVPGLKGRFQVLKNHAPLVSIFEIGMVEVVTPDKNSSYYATGGGTIEVLNNNVLILGDSLELVDKIDVDRAKNAKQRAEERLDKREEGTDIERAENALKRAVNRLNVVEKHLRAEV
ncbi:MAG: ATP synthase F1 subunit epsilon [Ignavibacteriaceae bacterium]